MDFEKMLPAAVEHRIADGNYDFMIDSRQSGMTIYGDIVAALEGYTEDIDKLAEQLGAFFAAKRGINITKQYEENSSPWEKFIKNNPLSLAQMEIQRQAEVELISGGIQGGIKIINWASKNILTHIEQKKAKDYIWEQCLIYANAITGGKFSNYPQVTAFLVYISEQLYGKIKNDFSCISTPNSHTAIFLNNGQKMQIAMLLYQIYAVKKYQTVTIEESQHDEKLLMNMWLRFGIMMKDAENLLVSCEKMNEDGTFPYGILNQLIQCFFNNLTFALPNISQEPARKINTQLLLYTPNGDKQIMARKATRFLSKAAITAVCTVGGIKTENSQLKNIAATTALSMFQNTDNPETIANCLIESGIAENDVKKCIKESKKKQNKLPPLI